MTKKGYKVEIGQSFDDFLSSVTRVKVTRPDGIKVYKFDSDDLSAIYDSIKGEVLAEASKRVLDD